MLIQSLTDKTFSDAVATLCAQDAILQQLVETYGPPPFWHRPEGFSSLILIMLEQKISLASAKAVYDRLVAAVGTLTPQSVLALEDITLRELGFSWQKVTYAKNIAQAIASEQLDLDRLSLASNEEVMKSLTQIKGVGPWTAEVYLLMSLRRPDIWPIGDLALVRAIQDLHELKEWPSKQYLTDVGEPWSPWRSVATRILWHFYLSTRKSTS